MKFQILYIKTFVKGKQTISNIFLLQRNCLFLSLSVFHLLYR